MQIKYLEERQRANGASVWVVNPPKHIKAIVEGAKYQQFADKQDAEHYATHLMGEYSQFKQKTSIKKAIDEATVLGLFTYYQSTQAFMSLKPNSQRSYLTAMAEVAKMPFASLKAVSVGPNEADKLYLDIKARKSVHNAVTICKIMRRIWFVGLRAGRVQSNPFQKMGLEAVEDRKVLWSPEQVQTFVDTADKLGTPSVGTLALLCYDLCQRPGDMRQLKWSDISNGTVRFTQEKTGVEMVLPLSPRLQTRLASMPKHSSDYVVVCESTHKPYDRRLYAKWAVRVRNAAKLPAELQIRDLRRTGATEMAEAGCTEDELRSVTGHQSRDVLSIYVRPTTKLAQAGINKRFAQ